MAGVTGRTARTAALAALLTLLLLLGAFSERTTARIGTSCDTLGNATITADDAGTKVRAHAGYRVDTFHEIGYGYRGTDINGMQLAGSSTCGDPDPYATLRVLLGDRGDRMRLDAAKFAPSGLKRIPNFVEVTAFGGSGNDVMRGHGGVDIFDAEAGDDVVNTDDRNKDTVDCGEGKDKAIVNRKDDVSGCEQVVK